MKMKPSRKDGAENTQTLASLRAQTLASLRAQIDSGNLTADTFEQFARRAEELEKVVKQTQGMLAGLKDKIRAAYNNRKICKLISGMLGSCGMSERSLSEDVGGSPSFLHRLRSGERRLTLRTTHLLADKLKLDGSQREELFRLAWEALVDNVPEKDGCKAGDSMWVKVQGDVGRLVMDKLLPGGADPKSIEFIDTAEEDGAMVIKVSFRNGKAKAVKIKAT